MLLSTAVRHRARRPVLAIGGIIALGCTVALGSFGCAKPEAPTLKPESMVVKAAGTDGLSVDLTLDAYNPNSIPLSAKSVKAKAKIEQKIDLGEVDVKTAVDIPAKKHAKITVPLKLPWNDVTSVALMAATKPSLSFSVDGTAAVGGDSVQFNVPFETSGSITREQLVEITKNAIPKLPF